MSSALKPVLTPGGAQNSSVAAAATAQMNKPMHPQGGTGSYSQPSLMSIPLGNPTPAHNMPHSGPHQNHYSLNIPNSYGGNPQASSHPVTSSHPIASQAHVQPVSYSPPKSQVFGQPYQMHSGVPPAQHLPPAVQGLPAQGAREADKPQSNGTADVKVNKIEANHVVVEKKEVLQPQQSPDKVKVPEKAPAVPVEVKQADVKESIQPAEIPQNVVASTPTSASASVTSANTQPQQQPAPIQPAIQPAPVKDPATAAPAPPSTANSQPSVPPASAAQQKSEPSLATTVESSTLASASSPTSSATTSTANATQAAPPVPKPVVAAAANVPVVADPAPATEEVAEKAPEAQEAQSTTADAAVAPVAASTPPKKEPNAAAPKSPLKVATPRTPARKSKTPKSDQESPKITKQREARDAVLSTPSTSTAKTTGGGKMKRNRTRTQPYQSPLPEIEIITKMTSTVSTPRSKNSDEKLIIFYKNEFLAVRNSEGGFYVCQAVQNVYKSSPKIRIRWLSQEKGEKSGDIYTPDFYDSTDFDCILTNLNLEREGKGKYRLPAKEKDRTDNILKRAIAVEKGEAPSLDDSLTEDNPDGLDVSLYRDEEQLKKRKRGTKRKASSRAPSSRQAAAAAAATKTSPENSKVRKVEPKTPKEIPTKTPKRNATRTTTAPATDVRKPVPSAGRAERAKRRSAPEPPPTKSSPVLDKKKASVLAKVAKRTAAAAVVKTPPPPATPKTSMKVTKQPVPSTSKAASKPTPSSSKATPTPPRRTKRAKK